MTLAYADEGSGRPLVFVHGMSADRSHWAPVAELLVDRYRCIRVDMPGHGESSDDGADTIGAAQRLQTTLAELGIERPVVIGHSAGGYVAVVAGVLFDVAGVVGTDDPRDPASFAATLEPYIDRLTGGDFDAAFHEWIAATYPADAVPEPRRSEAVAVLKPRKEIVMGFWAGLGDRRSAGENSAQLASALPALKAPFLGIYGSPLDDAAQAMIANIPNSTIEVWGGFGHFVHLVDPERFATRLSEFVERC